MTTHNLPPQPTSFVGRENELIGLSNRLADPDCRLLTLVGPGGIGKTRLAFETAARNLDDFGDGIVFVSLQPISSPDSLVTTMAEAIGFSFHGQQEPEVQLLRYLAVKQLLLMLDNFEHLLAGAELLVAILAAAPDIKLLVTSREALNLQAEWIWHVKGMRHPEAEQVEEIDEYSALKLFVERAWRVKQDFSPQAEQASIIRICQLVGGIPMAIELAAAWLKTLPCHKIVREIERNLDILATDTRDIPERHRSMRAVFEHSWNLLSEAERDVFKKLSVFRGGFRQAATEQVAGADLLTLSSLVDKSLLRVNASGRYEFHELLRQYAEERLEAADEENERVQGLHCDYYAEFLYQRRHDPIGPRQAEFMEEIEEEIENIRVAWNHAVARENLDAIGKSLDSLYRFYRENSWYLQGASACDKAILALRTCEATGKRDLILGRLLGHQASIHLGTYQNTEQAKELAQESLAILHRLGARSETSMPLFMLGYAARVQGEREEGKQLLQRSLLISREFDDRWGMAMGLAGLSQIADEGAHYKEGKQLRQESLALFRQIGDRWGIAWMLSETSRAALWRGALEKANQYAQESLAIAKESHSRQQVVISLLVLSNAAYAIGAYKEAKRYAREGLAITQAAAIFGNHVLFMSTLARINNTMQEYETARQLYQESLILAQEIDDQGLIAIPLQGLGKIAYCKADYPRAYQLHLESLTLLTDTNRRQSAGAVLNDLGLVTHALGDNRAAKAHFHEALKIGLEIGAFPILLETLVGIAELTASEGQFEPAVELLSLSQPHASSFADTRERAELILADLERELSPDAFTRAQQHGVAMDLDSAATAQLSELSRWLRANKETRLEDQPLVEPLSERELEVLGLIAEGMSNREIGERSFITVGTVKVHASNIYGKLEVSNRTQAVARGRELGLL